MNRTLARLVVALAMIGCQAGVVVPSPSPVAATATPSPAPTATAVVTATPAATPTPAALPRCDVYQVGDAPIVPSRASGRWLRVALDAIVPSQRGGTRWMVRFINPADAPATAEIPPSATLTGPAGSMSIVRYSAAPPNAGDEAVSAPIELAQCGHRMGGAVVLVVESARVTPGTHTLTVRGIRRPEGDRADESWTVACTADACR